MSATVRIPRGRLALYFDTFTKRFLKDGSPEAADVEVLAPDPGDKFAAAGARLVGVTYDPHDNALEFAGFRCRDGPWACSSWGLIVCEPRCELCYEFVTTLG
jgi:hypothetical protein